MEDLVDRFGLVAIFLGTALEGDLALILGGIAAHLGYVDPVAAGVAGTLGGFAGDATWFALARRHADMLRRSALYQRVGPTIERLAARFGPWQLLLARPVYGTRVASMLFWGTQRLAPGRFAALDLPACAVWAVLLVSLGYGSSNGVQALMGEVRRAEAWVAGALAVAAALAALGHIVIRRWMRHVG